MITEGACGEGFIKTKSSAYFILLIPLKKEYLPFKNNYHLYHEF